jgi:hypothetical protein
MTLIGSGKASWGAGTLGPKATRRRTPARRDEARIPHPVYGKHKMVTRTELAAEERQAKARKAELAQKFKKLADEKLAAKSAKWQAHREKKKKREAREASDRAWDMRRL